SPLVPYTTLFRSRPAARRLARGGRRPALQPSRGGARARGAPGATWAAVAPRCRVGCRRRRAVRRRGGGVDGGAASARGAGVTLAGGAPRGGLRRPAHASALHALAGRTVERGERAPRRRSGAGRAGARRPRIRRARRHAPDVGERKRRDHGPARGNRARVGCTTRCGCVVRRRRAALRPAELRRRADRHGPGRRGGVARDPRSGRVDHRAGPRNLRDLRHAPFGRAVRAGGAADRPHRRCDRGTRGESGGGARVTAAMGAGQVVLVRIADERFAVDAALVEEVVDGVHPRALPGLPAHSQGVLEHRGEWLPAIDPAPLLEIERADAVPASALIVRRGPVRFALSVDAVLRVTERPRAIAGPAPSGSWEVGRADGALLLEDEEGVITVLRPDDLFRGDAPEDTGESRMTDEHASAA